MWIGQYAQTGRKSLADRKVAAKAQPLGSLFVSGTSTQTMDHRMISLANPLPE